MSKWIPTAEKKYPDKMGEYLCEYKAAGMIFHLVLNYFPEKFGPWKAGWHNLGDALDGIVNHEGDMVAWREIENFSTIEEDEEEDDEDED